MAARSTPNVYQPAAGDTLVPGGKAIDEFGATKFLADCGQAAGEILYAWSHGTAPDKTHINAVVKRMQSLGLAGGGGVSSLSGNSRALASEGVPNFTTSNWLAALAPLKAPGVTPRPIEIGVGNAQALPGDERGVHGHFLTIEGYSPSHQAYIASDPDNAAAKSGQLVYYSAQQLRAAQPWGAIVPTQTSGALGGGPGSTGGGGQGTVTYNGQPVTNAQQASQIVVAAAGNVISNPVGAVASAVASWVAPLVMTVLLFVLALAAVGVGALLIFHDPNTAGSGNGGGFADKAKAAGEIAAAAG